MSAWHRSAQSFCPQKPRTKKIQGRKRERQIEDRRTVVCTVAIKSDVELQNLVPWLLVYRALQPLGYDAFLMGR